VKLIFILQMKCEIFLTKHIIYIPNYTFHNYNLHHPRKTKFGKMRLVDGALVDSLMWIHHFLARLVVH